MAEQPAPQPHGARVFDDLIAQLRAREAQGIATYGQTLHADDGRDTLVDAAEEALDLLAYLHKARMQRDALRAERDRLRAALRWALEALGDPPDFTGELADWERAKAALAPEAMEGARDG
jgi:hypothetical protein